MRVISGQARGRQLRAGKGQAIRPTAAKVKGLEINEDYRFLCRNLSMIIGPENVEN